MAKITLATLADASAQGVFNQVRDHLLRQGAQSLGSYGGHSVLECTYRGFGGTMCAAGCLIGDDEYDPKMEGRAWTGIVSDHGAPKVHEILISDLQLIHDHTDVVEWPTALRDLAATYGLNWNVTLASLPHSTAQEVFEQAVTHSLVQNERAYEGGACKYRTCAGLKCAAGALMSDEEAGLVGNGPWSVLVGDGRAPELHRDLIRNLQRVHDNNESERWRNEFTKVATEYGLDTAFMSDIAIPLPADA